MKETLFFIIVTMVWAVQCFAQNQPTLQPWLEKPGTVNGQELGKYVLGITPTANLPYKAAVSKNNSTSFFRLQSPTDTIAMLTLTGEHTLVGDLNNDGKTDVVIKKTIFGDDTVYIYWGTTIGIDTINPLVIPAENHADELTPSCLGDINNDGKIDLIMSAWGYPGGLNKGKIYIFISYNRKYTRCKYYR